MTMIPYHRIAAQLYNRPLLLVPAAAFAASDYLLSRMNSQGQVNQFVGERRTDDCGSRLPYRVTDDGIAIVTIIGELVPRSIGWADADCGLVSYEFIEHQFATADADPNVLGILVDLDSPGGDSAGCFSIHNFIRKIATRKPVVSFVNTKALSGGYSIASATSWIVSPRDSEVGSIGVWMLHYDVSKHLEQHGVKPTLLWRGARKVDGHPFGPLSQEAENSFGADLDHIYSQFTECVATARAGRVTLAGVVATEAACFYGDDALKIGLVDQVGTFADALVAVRSLRPGGGTAPVLLTGKAVNNKRLTPKASARVAEEKMENCATDNCGHPRANHPDDGACNVEGGCSGNCQGYTAPAAESGASGSQARAVAGAQALPAANSVTAAKELADLRAENERFRTQARIETGLRIASEVKQFSTALLTKDDLRFNTQETGVMGNLLLVAKSAAAGISVVSIGEGDQKREVKTDAASLGAFVVEQIGVLTNVSAKFSPPTGELPTPSSNAAISGVTLADFAKATHDAESGRRIAAAVRARRKETANKAFSRADLYRELGGK